MTQFKVVEKKKKESHRDNMRRMTSSTNYDKIMFKNNRTRSAKGGVTL